MVGVVQQAPFLWRPGVEDERPVPAYDVDARPRRQDLPAERRWLRETGSLYLTRTGLYLGDPGNRLGGRITLFEMAAEEGLDIDTEADLRYAEAVLAQNPDRVPDPGATGGDAPGHTV